MQANTTYGAGGITTRTSAPVAGPGPAFNTAAIAQMLMQRLQQRQARDNMGAGIDTSYHAAPPASAPQGAGGSVEEPYYVKQVSSPGSQPFWSEVPAGTPGAVMGGYRPRGSGGGGGGGGAAPRESAAPSRGGLADPTDTYIQDQARAQHQQDDGKFAVSLPGANPEGVDLLR